MSELSCPMCGTPVRVYAADEGTQSYQPIAEAERDRLREALTRVQSVVTKSGLAPRSVKAAVQEIVQEALAGTPLAE